MDVLDQAAKDHQARLDDIAAKMQEVRPLAHDRRARDHGNGGRENHAGALAQASKKRISGNSSKDKQRRPLVETQIHNERAGRKHVAVHEGGHRFRYVASVASSSRVKKTSTPIRCAALDSASAICCVAGDGNMYSAHGFCETG